MKRQILAASLAVVIFSSVDVALATPPTDFDAYAQRVLQGFDVPGMAVAIVENGRTVHARGYGVRRFDRPEKVDEHTAFPIGSNTKAFTAAALAILVSEGKLRWDDRVVDHLPKFRMHDAYVSREMTVRDLLTHRSGLGLGQGDLLFMPETTFSRDDIVSRLAYLVPKTGFRSGYAYNNVLYVVAGQVVASVAGQSWETFVRERILTPLAMRDSVTERALLRSMNQAGLHVRTQATVRGLGPQRVLEHVPALDNVAAAGGIYSSAADLGEWMRALLDTGEPARLFTAAAAREMWTPQTIMPIPPTSAALAGTQPAFRAYGLGWILQDYRGHRIVLHSGAVPGAVSLIAFLPEHDVGIAVLLNGEESGAHRAVMYRLLDHYLGLSETDWVTAFADARREALRRAEEELKAWRPAACPQPTRPTARLDRYAGIFRDPWYGTITLRSNSRRLELRFDHTPTMIGELEQVCGETFRTHWRHRSIEDAYLTFNVNAEDRVVGITMKPVSPHADFSFDYQDLAFERVTAESPAPAVESSAGDARAFVAEAERSLAEASEFAQRAAWVRNTDINDDSMWLEARAAAEYARLSADLARRSVRFATAKVDPMTRRKLDLLRMNVALPPPARAGAAKELTTLATRLDSAYSQGHFQFEGRARDLAEAEHLLASSRDPRVTQAVYEGWRTIAAPMKGDYAKMVSLANEGARELAFRDVGELWRSVYDMPPDVFAAEVERLWAQVRPLYVNLHCYVRARLNERYGDAVQPRTGPLRADLLGNMWSQRWDAIYDVVAPRDFSEPFDLTQALVARRYKPEDMIRTAEAFYTSLGFPALPASFWTRSMFTKPPDRNVVCHASAWDVDNRADLRVKMCTRIDGQYFYTVHHELGHLFYDRAYEDQPFLFQNGANDGFQEGLGDFIGLSAVTPGYLNRIGLVERVPDAAGDIPLLLRRALDRVAFLPFSLAADRWRWDVFAGRVPAERYNAAWSALMLKYQGIVPPTPPAADGFDAGSKYHVAANVPLMSYFMARIYQFQFQRAACRMARWAGPLHRCSIYASKEVGERLARMLALGRSRPWPEVLATFSGERAADASAIMDHFATLNAWLARQNRGAKCGW